MTYIIIYSDKAYRQFKKLERNVQERIKAALERVIILVLKAGHRGNIYDK